MNHVVEAILDLGFQDLHKAVTRTRPDLMWVEWNAGRVAGMIGIAEASDQIQLHEGQLLRDIAKAWAETAHKAQVYEIRRQAE